MTRLFSIIILLLVMPMASLASDDGDIRDVLTRYHHALTLGDMQKIESYVITDENFVMLEGKHSNWGWVDYRDNHLTPELDGLSKVDFRLEYKGVHVAGDMAYVSFLFFLHPKGDISKNYGSGRATAVLVRTPGGWRIQHLHTS